MTRQRIYAFDSFTLDTHSRMLYRSGEPVRLAPKVFSTLLYLIERPNQIVIKEELINAIWGGAKIETGGIARNISALRTALNDNENTKYIVTVAKRGYKFCANVYDATAATDRTEFSGNGSNVLRSLKNPTPERQTGGFPWFTRFIGGEYPIIIGLIAIVLATAFVIPTRLSWQEFTRKQLTSNSPDLPIIGAAISPDGKSIAYTELNKVYVALIGSAERKSVASPANTIPGHIEWFPDNKTLLVCGFNADLHRAMIWKTSIDGEQVQEIKVNASSARLSPDGSKIIYVKNRTQLWVADIDGNNAKQVAITTARSQFWLLPQFSADSAYAITARKDNLNHHTVIEARQLSSGATTVLYQTDSYITDFYLLPSNDLFVSQFAEQGSNITSTEVDLQRGTHGTTHVIGNWPSGNITQFSASADGRRVAIINDQSQSDVYVADLQAGGNAIKNAERLTMDDRNDRPAGWWSDNKSVLFYSDRHDSYGIYKQSKEQPNADTLISDSRDNTWPVLSPDGQWLLYFTSAADETRPNTKVSLMRKPIAGGPAELIDTRADIYRSIRCAYKANRCVLAEHTTDQSIYYEFNAEKGRGNELARTPWSSGYDFYDWDVSPDATRIAYVDTAEGSSSIGIITLGEQLTIKHMTVPGFEQISTLMWDSNGKGFYISSHESDSETAPLVLLHATLDGRIATLRYQLNSIDGWAIPSPDGQRLAFQQWSSDGNVWLLEK
ncbi:MAG TPA: LpqB family beta-propeller domain-containing protein [Steroidobacteraceae bacterium]|jgi:DNA-binding winged helix-turn-helix (wHTH) protein/Tol biopolymer transport system component|nr:LpqB family beta-propeller domain-containing protein [Steroidobacteraceae bacterium]